MKVTYDLRPSVTGLTTTGNQKRWLYSYLKFRASLVKYPKSFPDNYGGLKKIPLVWMMKAIPSIKIIPPSALLCGAPPPIHDTLPVMLCRALCGNFQSATCREGQGTPVQGHMGDNQFGSDK